MNQVNKGARVYRVTTYDMCQGVYVPPLNIEGHCDYSGLVGITLSLNNLINV